MSADLHRRLFEAVVAEPGRWTPGGLALEVSGARRGEASNKEVRRAIHDLLVGEAVYRVVPDESSRRTRKLYPSPGGELRVTAAAVRRLPVSAHARRRVGADASAAALRADKAVASPPPSDEPRVLHRSAVRQVFIQEPLSERMGEHTAEPGWRGVHRPHHQGSGPWQGTAFGVDPRLPRSLGGQRPG